MYKIILLCALFTNSLCAQMLFEKQSHNTWFSNASLEECKERKELVLDGILIKDHDWLKIRAMTQLKKLSISNRIPYQTILANVFEDLQNLEELTLELDSLNTFPQSIGGLKKLRKLKLYSAEAKAIPQTYQNLEDLEELDLSNVSFHKHGEPQKTDALPEVVFENLKNLKRLHLSLCNLEFLPVAIGTMPQLEYLDVSLNFELKELPPIRMGIKVEKTFCISMKEGASSCPF